jgi:hypothetical protein
MADVASALGAGIEGSKGMAGGELKILRRGDLEIKRLVLDHG